MKTLSIVIALALGALAGCDRNPQPPATPKATPGSAAPATPQANTPTTPANTGTPSAAEKASGSQPVQGQVDPKQTAQQKDFQQKGDATGPKK